MSTIDPGNLMLTPEQRADDADSDPVVEALAVRLYENDPESEMNQGDDVEWRDNYADRDQYRGLARTAIAFFGSSVTAAPGPQQPDEVRWTYPEGRSVALHAWEKAACARCRQVVDALESHRCAPAQPDEVEAAVAVAMVAYDWAAYPAPDGGGEPVAEAVEDAVRLALARYIEGTAAPSAQPDEDRCPSCGEAVVQILHPGSWVHTAWTGRCLGPAQPVRDTEEGRR